MIKTISYLGLGTMGSGMASNLLKADGHEHGPSRDKFVRTGTLRKARRRFSRCAKAE